MIDYVQFFPTTRCNRKCEFCFSRNLIYSDFPEINIKSLATILEKNRIKKLDILGGEPFLYEHLETLLKELLNKEIEITISTNGTLKDKLENFLKNFRNKKLRIGVSINDHPTNDLINIIKRHKLWIKSVITKNKLPPQDILEFANNEEIKYYFIYMDALTEEDLTVALSFPEFIKTIKYFKNSYTNIEPVFCKGFISNEKSYRCPAGTEKITLMPDGSVYPCYLLANHKEYCIGNIFKNSFRDILRNSVLNIFRKFNGNVCNNNLCELYNTCKGGCVAHSIIHYKNFNDYDPRCKIIMRR